MSFFNKLGQMLGVGKKKTALPETEQHAFQIKLYGYNEYRTALQTLHDHLRNFLTHMRTTIRGSRDIRFASLVSQFRFSLRFFYKSFTAQFVLYAASNGIYCVGTLLLWERYRGQVKLVIASSLGQQLSSRGISTNCSRSLCKTRVCLDWPCSRPWS